MPIVSIIVPVYKAEKYLRRCLDSIQTQTLTDFEALLIDDGSPDRSGEICDEYVEKDERFRVFHKENGGVASARQMGMDHAQGEYIIHCDPDDWVESNWLECLLTNAMENDSDMVICDFYIHKLSEIVYSNQCPQSLNNADIVEELIADKIWGCCWNKLIRRSCFYEYQVTFVKSMIIWEDLYVICALLQHPIKVSYVNKPLYNYDTYINNCSIVRFRSAEHVFSFMTFIDHYENIFNHPRYEEGWYYRKCFVKGVVYRLRNSGYSVKNIYYEINQRYICESRKVVKWSEPFYISLCLRGIPTPIVKYLSKIINLIVNVKKLCK